MASQGMSDLGSQIGGELVKGGAHLPAAAQVPGEFQDILDASSLEEAVALSLGAASVCWTGDPQGTFESDRCRAIMDALIARINKSSKGVVTISHKTVMKMQGDDAGSTRACFVQVVDDGEIAHQFFPGRKTWEEMGSPREITITVEPGDLLNT